MEAVEYRQVDEDYLMHKQAFLGLQVQAKRKVGKAGYKPVYDRFDKFYDYEKELEKVKNRHNKKNSLSKVSRYLKQQKGRKDG